MSFVPLLFLQRRLLMLIIKAFRPHGELLDESRKWFLLSIKGSADGSSAKHRNRSVLEFIFIIQTTDQRIICR